MPDAVSDTPNSRLVDFALANYRDAAERVLELVQDSSLSLEDRQRIVRGWETESRKMITALGMYLT